MPGCCFGGIVGGTLGGSSLGGRGGFSGLGGVGRVGKVSIRLLGLLSCNPTATGATADPFRNGQADGTAWPECHIGDQCGRVAAPRRNAGA